jgi:chromosome segregation ATPase
MEYRRNVTVYGQNVDMDAAKLAFSEGTLSEYLETEGGWIDYYGAKLAEAEKQYAEMEMEVEREEDEYDRTYSRVFSTIKDTEGGSDKLTEGKAKVEQQVIDARKKVLEQKAKAIELKYVVRLLQQHLRAWDKNHENAQNRGNTLRKELERLYKDKVTTSTYEDKMDDIIKSVDIG